MTIETRPVEVSVKTAGDVLRHAALIIEERGWTQGEFYSAKGVAGPYCAVGSISVVLNGHPVPEHLIHPAYDALARSLRFGTNCSRVIEWNDQKGRTAAEVVAAFRAAAEEADRGR